MQISLLSVLGLYIPNSMAITLWAPIDPARAPIDPELLVRLGYRVAIRRRIVVILYRASK